MAEPFVAEIRIFSFDFAPKNWAFCDGQTLKVQQNSTLFSLIGTIYGGNGTTEFALPDLRGRAPMQADVAPQPVPPGTIDPGTGLLYHDLGETGGSETVTLTANQLPAHSHALGVQGFAGDNNVPTGNNLSRAPDGLSAYVPPANATLAPMSPAAIVPAAGGGGAHNNLMPFLTLRFCIALAGMFPPRG